MGFLRDEILGALIFGDGKAGDAGAAGAEQIKAVAVVDHGAEIEIVVGGEVMVDLDAELGSMGR